MFTPSSNCTQLLPQVGKIAVLRANALGDFVFALPAVEALRSDYPAAVGDALAAAGAQVVVTGTAPEQGLAEAVVNHMRAKALNAAG